MGPASDRHRRGAAGRVDLGSPRLRMEARPPVATCVVDNPARRNALSGDMYRGLATAIGWVRDHEDLDALILTGCDDVFIVGGDLDAHHQAEPGEDHESPTALLLDGAVPVVAAVNGHCQASGVLFALLADVAVASDRAVFRLPELRLGVAAPWSSALLSAFIGLGRAKELALTARSIDAHEAHAIGLVARVVPHDELAAAARATAIELLEAAPAARRRWVRAVHASLAPVSDAAAQASIDTPEAREGFAAFLARRPPTWSPRGTSPTPVPPRDAETATESR